MPTAISAKPNAIKPKSNPDCPVFGNFADMLLTPEDAFTYDNCLSVFLGSLLLPIKDLFP